VKILVTGGAGYVGSHAVKELIRKGYGVVVYDNLSRGYRWAVKGGDFIEGDLADKESLRQLFSNRRVDAVMHFAAFAYVGESMENPRRYYENNVRNSLNLIEAMLNYEIKTVVFSSTCAVYGLPREIPITESHPVEPVNPYGLSKAMVERVLADYDRAHGLRYVSLRYFNAAGADAEGELGENHQPETHLIPRTLQTALGQQDHLEIYGTDYPTKDGTCIRDYVHVSDLSKAHLLALDWVVENKVSAIFNLGTERGYSVSEVIEEARRVTGRKISTKIGERRQGDPPVLISSSEKARRELGWEPRFSSLSSILETAWEWHRKRR
jgi:UDP-glucose 4-epimerase